MDKMIEVEDICKHYETFDLEDVSFEVGTDEIVGLVGSNGAGKTTTLKALLGLIRLDSGTAKILGASLYDSNKRSDDVKDRIGVVFDTCAFPNESKIADVELMGRLSFPNWSKSEFERLCDRFQIDSSKRVKDLSRGMGMKLTLAFALAHDPDVLILDEATAGLDPMARDEALDELRLFMEKGERAILLSTHITTDLEKIADRVICLDDGHMVFDLCKDDITDIAGIARCKASDLETIEMSGWLDEVEGKARVIKGTYGIDVLVPNRADFVRRFPDIACDKTTIEDYIAMRLKGDAK